MSKRSGRILILVLLLGSACSPRTSSPPDAGIDATRADIQVLTSTTFLRDIAQNVAGSRLTVESLLPAGVDPHSYQPVPADLAKISDSKLLIVNGAEYEEFLGSVLENAEGEGAVSEAAAGLELRRDPEMEHGVDPHLWMDPNNVIVYVQNIRDGLMQADPQGESLYRSNAEAYTLQLKELDGWIMDQVGSIPPERRLLVTNHDALGYFAERYGFQIVGTILKSVSSQASISARELAAVVDEIRTAGVPAIFLDEVENPNFAQQVAEESGAAVVPGLHVESLTEGPPAGTYLDMMRYNVTTIVEALK